MLLRWNLFEGLGLRLYVMCCVSGCQVKGNDDGPLKETKTRQYPHIVFAPGAELGPQEATECNPKCKGITNSGK